MSGRFALIASVTVAKSGRAIETGACGRNADQRVADVVHQPSRAPFCTGRSGTASTTAPSSR